MVASFVSLLPSIQQGLQEECELLMETNNRLYFRLHYCVLVDSCILQDRANKSKSCQVNTNLERITPNFMKLDFYIHSLVDSPMYFSYQHPYRDNQPFQLQVPHPFLYLS